MANGLGNTDLKQRKVSTSKYIPNMTSFGSANICGQELVLLVSIFLEKLGVATIG